jgi:hypothetical protein
MNIFTFFRKSSFIFISAIGFLALSCTQYDLNSSNQNFDYSAHISFISNKSLINSLISTKYSKSISSKEISQDILNKVNIELGTNIAYPDLALNLTDYDRDEILDISLKQGWTNQRDIDLNSTFLNDLQTHDFDYALSNFENTVLKLELSKDEFAKLNIFANLVKSINYQYPNLFDLQNSQLARGFWACAGATLALAAATAGLSSCLTIVACGAAFLLHVVAMTNFGDKCLKE